MLKTRAFSFEEQMLVCLCLNSVAGSITAMSKEQIVQQKLYTKWICWIASSVACYWMECL